MNKQKINYFIDLGMFITLAISMLAIPLKIRDAHELFGGIFLVLFVVHLAMHWKMFIIMHKNLALKK
jgi:hypothetical protein